MYTEEEVTQVTFFYDTGESDSFNVPIVPEELQKQINLLLERPWLTFHLFDRTVFICMARVVKVEVAPTLEQMVGVGVFGNVEERMMRQRAAQGRFTVDN